MLLTTMAALELQVSLAKGERASTVHWVGVKFFLKDDLIILSLPERFTKDLLSLLKGWDNKGMAPLKELRQAAGKLSWLSGILPKARWLLSLFFRVLHDRLDDIVSGEEARRRNQRADQRPKDGLFAVKLLEQARQWLITFLDVAMERPQRAVGRGSVSKRHNCDGCKPQGYGSHFVDKQQTGQRHWLSR